MAKVVFFLDQQLEHRDATRLVYAVFQFAAIMLDVLSRNEPVHEVLKYSDRRNNNAPYNRLSTRPIMSLTLRRLEDFAMTDPTIGGAPSGELAEWSVRIVAEKMLGSKL